MITRRISNSEIQSWKRCRRQWWLAWHRGLQQRHVSPLGALAIGARGHEALAAWYVPDGQKRIDPRQALEVLLKRDLAAANATDKFSVDDLKQFQSEADLLKIMLEGYMQWLEETGADQDYEIIMPEAYHEVELSPSLSMTWDMLVMIIGRLDVEIRHRENGMRFFLDHKTTSDIKRSIRGLKMNPQMRMYRLIFELFYPDEWRIGGAVYSMLRKVKRTVRANPPFYHREYLTFNPLELDAFKRQLLGTVHEILAADADMRVDATAHHYRVPPTSGTHCQMCPFERECSMFDDGSRVEDALASRFIKGEPLHYYGRSDLGAEDGRGVLTAHPLRIQAG